MGELDIVYDWRLVITVEERNVRGFIAVSNITTQSTRKPSNADRARLHNIAQEAAEKIRLLLECHQ